MNSASFLALVRLPVALVCACALLPFCHAQEGLGNMKAERILFLGNSLCLHGIWKEGGWPNYCGMAASVPEKDFVHLVVAGLDARTGDHLKLTPPDPEKSPSIEGANVVNIADILERQYPTYTNDRLRWQLDYKPDIVVFQFGENMDRGAFNADAFRKAFKTLMDGLRDASNPHIFVTNVILGNGGAIDDIKREVCAEDPTHRHFVDLSDFPKDPKNFASSETFYTGVITGHPGDHGMSVIADALLKAIFTVADAK
jgi:lysophospholipase L1-like esterase